MTPRILARRYPLNLDCNTWLEVGISIMPEPHVEIALINKQHKEIPLNEAALEKLYDKKDCILHYLMDNNPRYRGDILALDYATLKFGMVEERSTICFSAQNIDILIGMDTCQTLLRLHDAVLSKIDELKSNIPAVKSQLKAFAGIVRELENKDHAYAAIASSHRFHKGYQIDNELVALALNDIIKCAKPQDSIDPWDCLYDDD